MAADEIAIDPLSLDKFHSTLQARLDEASTALQALTSGSGDGPPALGGFRDAVETTRRQRGLHEEYVERLRRLVVALTVVQSATAAIADAFRTAEAHSTAEFRGIGVALHLVGKARDGGRDNA